MSKTNLEIDALVAEKVMGCSVATEYDPIFERDGLFCRCPKKSGLYPHGSLFGGKLFDYCDHLADAWQVVEKMLEFNPFWNKKDNLNFELCPTRPKGWVCNFGDDTTRAYADTPPMAICLAALKAVGITVYL